MKLDSNFAYVCGGAASAYEPELGVLRFDRYFLFTAPDGFAIWDDLAAKEPRTFTSLLHVDERIEALGKNSYIIKKTQRQTSRYGRCARKRAGQARTEHCHLGGPSRPG